MSADRNERLMNAAAGLPPTPPTRREFWAGLAIFVLVTITYLPALRCGFIWDDDEYVTDNPTLRTADGLRRIWLEPRSTPQYYPLVFTTFWVEYHLWGLSPAGYHLVNIMLHAANAWLVWLVLRRLRIPGAWLAAAIFGLHPVHVESVAWITERKNVLSGLFYLGALLVYLDVAALGRLPAEKTDRCGIRYIVATVLFVAALLSKSVTGSLPAAILLLILWKHGRITWTDVRSLMPWFALGLSLGINTALLEKSHVGAVGAPFTWSFVERCLIAGRALCFYAGKLAWPNPLIFLYPRWTIDAGNVVQWTYPAAALSVVALFLYLRRRWGYGPLVAVLFFGGTLFPALGFVNVYPMRYSFVADHFQYLASLGPIALVVAAASSVIDRWPILSAAGRKKETSPRRASTFDRRSIPALLLAALLLGLLARKTWNQESVYRDAEALWSDVLARNPQSGIAHFYLGKIRTAQGRAPEATRHFHEALRLQTDDTELHIINTLLANSLVREGDMTGARAAFEAALRQQPDFWEALNGLGNLLARKGNVEEAIKLYRRALAAAPQEAAVHHNLANALAVKGDLVQSEQYYREAIRLNPTSAAAHMNFGNLLARQERYSEAEQEFVAALDIDPHLEPARRNLARVRTARQ
jgi:Flp pilus assembly protein TadD